MNISDEDNLPENIEIEGSEIEENSDDEQYDDEDVKERNTNIEEDGIPPLPPPISCLHFLLSHLRNLLLIMINRLLPLTNKLL